MDDMRGRVLLIGILVFALAIGAAPLVGADTPPGVRINHPPNGSTVSGTVIVSGNAWDDVEVVVVKVRIDSGELHNATDTSGNSTWWTWEYEWDTTKVENGWHRVVAVAYDNAGQAADIGIEVYVDNGPSDTPPGVRINHPPNGSTVSGTVVVSGNAWDDREVLVVKVRIDSGEWHNATDTSGNYTWWTWEYEWDTTTVEDGWHRVAAAAWDNGGHAADIGIEVYVDNGVSGENRRPVVVIDEPPNHSTVRGIVTVKGRSEDPDAGDLVELVQVRIDQGEWQNATDAGGAVPFSHWEYAWNTSEHAEGWHGFSARAWDGELYSEVVVFEYFVDNIPGENQAPTTTIIHPKAEETAWGVYLVHGTAADPDDGDRVELVQARIDDGAWNDAVDTSHDDSWSTWAYHWNTKAYANGLHHVCARAYDGDLWGAPTCRVAKVLNEEENAKPKVWIVHPKNGQTVEGVYLIHGGASDDHGVEFVEVRFKEEAWLRATDTSPDGSWLTWAYEWDTRERDDGCLHVSARAWDGKLFSDVAKIEVCIDNIDLPPTVKIVHPENNETVHGLVLIHGVSEDDEGVKLVQVKIDAGEWRSAKNTGWERPWSTWAYEWNTKEWDDGRHEICARAWDGLQYSTLSCVVVEVDNSEGGGAPPIPMGGDGALLLAGGLLAGLGVAILMWLRAHGFIRR